MIELNFLIRDSNLTSKMVKKEEEYVFKRNLLTD